MNDRGDIKKEALDPGTATEDGRRKVRAYADKNGIDEDMSQVNITVEKLIKFLEKLPSDLPILTHGYKEHYDAILEPVLENVKYNEENDDICGMYEMCDEGEEGSFEAVILFRNGRF